MIDLKEQKPQILLLGNYRPSLILARTFGKHGFEIAVGSHGCERLCRYSSSVSSIWDHDSLDAGPFHFVSELKTYADQHPELAAIVPVAEEYVRMIAENETLFDGLPSIVTMDHQLVMKCLDKEFMLNLARSTDVHTAPFAYTTGLAAASKAGAEVVRYPMIIRPKDSTKRIDGKKAICVENESGLVHNFRAHYLEDQELLLQKKFEGKRHNIYFAANRGEIIRGLHAVIDRTDKIDDTGLAVEGRTLEMDHEIVRQTQLLLEELNYSGIGCAQFLVDEQTGETSFLEINPRIAGNHALPEYAGLDLGWFNFERIVHKTVSRKKFNAPGGIRYSWSTGDLMGVKVAFLRGEIDIFGAIGWCVKALSSAFRADLHITFDIRDPYPAIRGLWNVVPRIARWQPTKAIPGENTIYSREERRIS